jgi:hypothetical protein
MARKYEKGIQRANAVALANGGNPANTDFPRIRELIAGRHSKAAVQLAKDLHKRAGTPESEALLLDAYQCRIEDMMKLGMAVEAKTLLQMVGERFPSSRARMLDLQWEISAAEGRLDHIVAPLADVNLPAKVRERIEGFVRQRVYDLPALAAVSSLPPEHPLRDGAVALEAAFRAVTRGPVDDQVLALPQVSRRSALGGWKALIWAIASFYRREDDACQKWLRLVPTDSAPAALIRPLLAMLGTATAKSEFNPAEQRLLSAVGGGSAALRPALVALEEALTAKKRKALLDATRSAVAICGQCFPKIRERLRQHILIRSLARGLWRSEMLAAIGGAPRENAYFWRLMARSFEHHMDWDNIAEALFHWESFRREAIREKWFAAGSLEDGVLSLHMAKLAEGLAADSFDEFDSMRPLRRDRSVGGLENDDLHSPEMLYERACRADPHPDAFQAWLHWADRHRGGKAADQVAELWRQARPGDTKPPLYLMESAEKRGAYRKSLEYLESAEELDRLNPDVRRAKLRLLLSAAIRHLRQRKTHLVKEAEIEPIEALPEVREGEIASLGTVLRLLSAVLDGDKVSVEQHHERLQSLLGGRVPAFVLTYGLAKTANLDGKVELPTVEPARFSAAELLTGTTRAVALGDWAGLELPLPPFWEEHLLVALDQPDCPTDITQLLVLGEAALRSEALKLAYAASAVGLARGTADARFLFLRGRVLPDWRPQRQEGCFTAALEIARRERNLELAGNILDEMRENDDGFWGADFLDDATANRPVPAELLKQILEGERAEKQFPVYERSSPVEYSSKLRRRDCDCPDCRARRGETPSEWGEDDGGDQDQNEFAEPLPAVLSRALEEFEQFLDRLPPRIARKVEEAIARGEPPEIAVPRIFKNLPPEMRPPAPGGKTKKGTGTLPSPAQGNLF